MACACICRLLSSTRIVRRVIMILFIQILSSPRPEASSIWLSHYPNCPVLCICLCGAIRFILFPTPLPFPVLLFPVVLWSFPHTQPQQNFRNIVAVFGDAALLLAHLVPMCCCWDSFAVSNANRLENLTLCSLAHWNVLIDLEELFVWLTKWSCF